MIFGAKVGTADPTQDLLEAHNKAKREDREEEDRATRERSATIANDEVHETASGPVRKRAQPTEESVVIDLLE
jgi:hypothetical protein